MGDPSPLEERLAGYDVFDLFGALVQAIFAGFAPPAQAWGRPAGVLAEFAMARLLTRARPEPENPASAPLDVVDLCLALEGALGAERIAEMPTLDPDDLTGQLSSVHRRFMSHQVMAYDPVIIQYEMRRLPELFGPYAASLRRAVGIDLDATLAITDTLTGHTFGWIAHELGLTAPVEGPQAFIDALARATSGGAGAQVRIGGGQSLVLSRSQLVAAGHDAEDVEKFLEIFALRPPLAPADVAFDEQVDELRVRPVVDWDDRICLPSPYNLGVIIRPRLEAELRNRDGKAAAIYDAAKASWLEREALNLVQQHLRPDQLFRDLHVPGQQTPPQRDGLARLDMCLLAIECKGGGISPSARRGRMQSQDTTLQRLVHDGVEQARSTLHALAAGLPVTGVELPKDTRRVNVDIGQTIRQLALVITLEDVGGVSARTQALFGEGTDAEDVPLVLSVDDLEWYATELGSRAQLMHYLICRQRAGTAAMAVMDEADWFRLYLQNGAPGIAEWMEHTRDLPTQIMGYAGDTRRAVPEPRLTRREPPLLDVAERWEQDAVDGWLHGVVALLDMSDTDARFLVEGLSEAHRQAANENCYAMLTLRPAADRSTALHVLVPPPAGESLSSTDLGGMVSQHSRDEDQLRLMSSCIDGTLASFRFEGVVSLVPVDGSSPADSAGSRDD
jgi:hypothetical protein